MAKPKTVTRDKLYEEVWQTPGRKLAERYCVSDVALAKICRKLNVPRPYRGYWSRIQAGQQPKRTPLPRAKPDTVTVHEFTMRDKQSAASHGGVAAKRKAEFQRPISVPERLKNLHPLLEASREELKRGDQNWHWDSLSYMRRHFSIPVHPKARPRAFRIMNALLKAIEGRGYDVQIATCYYGGGCAVIFGQEIRFDMRDRDCALPGDGAPGSAPFGWSWEKGPAKVRRGLVFRVHKSWYNGCGTSHWRDGKQQRLEDLLDQILLQMVQLARRDRHYEIQEEKWRAEREEQKRLQRLREAEIAAEKKRRGGLMSAALSWKRSALLREFIQAVETKIGDDHRRVSNSGRPKPG
jgi:hypothetical protein